MSQGNPDEISCITCHNVLPPADEYEQLTMQRHVKDFSQYSAQTEVLINKEFVDEKAPGKSRSHCSKTESTTSKLNENLFESDEHEQLEEYGLQKHGQTVYDHRDGAPQIFKQTAHTISEEGVLPTTNCLQDCNQSADQVQSSSPLGKRLVCLSEQLDTGDHNSLKSKCHVTKESTYRNVHHVSCLPDECSAGTSPSSSECGETLNEGAASADVAEVVTTLMIRNLPRDISQCQLLDEVNASGFAGVYDFCYMPCNFKLGTGQGFAFINLISPDFAKAFKRDWHRSFRFDINPNGPGLNVSFAALQGKEANVAKWDASRLRRVRNPRLRPFVQDNPAALSMPSNEPCTATRPKVPAHVSSRTCGVKRQVKLASAIDRSARLGQPVLLNQLLQ